MPRCISTIKQKASEQEADTRKNERNFGLFKNVTCLNVISGKQENCGSFALMSHGRSIGFIIGFSNVNQYDYQALTIGTVKGSRVTGNS